MRTWRRSCRIYICRVGKKRHRRRCRELVDAVALVGSEGTDRRSAHEMEGVARHDMLIGTSQVEALRTACGVYACRSSSANDKKLDSTLPGCRHSRTEITQSH